MSFVETLAWIVSGACQIAFYLLLARIIVDFVAQLRPDWRPRGAMLFISVWVLRLTDPPLRAVRKVVKPLRVGGAQLDLAMLVLLLALFVLTNIAAAFRGA